MNNFINNKIISKQLNNKLPRPGKTGLDWFLFCYFSSLYKNKPVLEIGAGAGGSVCSLMAFTDDITIIDSWDQGWNKSSVEKFFNLENKNVKFIDAKSQEINVDLLEKYAFVHLDANKSFELTTKDLQLVSQCCTGMICVDDYMNSMWPDVTWAVDEFVKQNPRWKKILLGNHQIFLSQQSHNCKELIVEFPIDIRNNIMVLTYGKLPLAVDEFILSSKMKYSWHDIAWIEEDKDAF